MAHEEHRKRGWVWNKPFNPKGTRVLPAGPPRNGLVGTGAAPEPHRCPLQCHLEGWQQFSAGISQPSRCFCEAGDLGCSACLGAVGRRLSSHWLEVPLKSSRSHETLSKVITGEEREAEANLHF